MKFLDQVLFVEVYMYNMYNQVYFLIQFVLFFNVYLIGLGIFYLYILYVKVSWICLGLFFMYNFDFYVYFICLGIGIK